MKAVVKRIEDGMDPRDVHCTTYQMRNCFRQFYDGVATELDVHCYFQHAMAADLCKPGHRVLDVCCGRGLLIPFLRYRARKPALYCGVDIEPRNAVFSRGLDPRRSAAPTTSDTGKEWGFPTLYVQASVDGMVQPVRAKAGKQHFDLIVYTSAIEHMQPDSQRMSLLCCRDLLANGGQMYLTCPVSEPGKSGYETQYRAHVYEPTEQELQEWLGAAGFCMTRRTGLCTSAKHFRSVLTGKRLDGAEYLYKIMPREQALPTIAALYPEAAQEVAYLCRQRT